jgi:hypothetical protein
MKLENRTTIGHASGRRVKNRGTSSYRMRRALEWATPPDDRLRERLIVAAVSFPLAVVAVYGSAWAVERTLLPMPLKAGIVSFFPVLVVGLGDHWVTSSRGRRPFWKTLGISIINATAVAGLGDFAMTLSG